MRGNKTAKAPRSDTLMPTYEILKAMTHQLEYLLPLEGINTLSQQMLYVRSRLVVGGKYVMASSLSTYKLMGKQWSGFTWTK